MPFLPAPVSLPSLAFAPWRLSGQVIGVLMNDPAALAALGESVNAAPYKAAPKAPVLYIKPRNTLAASGASTPGLEPGFEVGANLGAIISRPASKVSEAQALDYIGGYLLVADLVIPHSSFYRPSVRQRARDYSCIIAAQVSPAEQVPTPDNLVIEVSVNQQVVQRASTAGRVRSMARLLQDVSAFMTLSPGDILLLGSAFGSPLAKPGDQFTLSAPGLAEVCGRVCLENPEPVSAP